MREGGCLEEVWECGEGRMDETNASEIHSCSLAGT